MLAPRSATLSERLYDWKESFEVVAAALAFSSANGKRLLKVNEAFARLHGYERAALSGTSVEQLVAVRGRARVMQHMSEASTADQYVYKATHLRRDGSAFRAQIDVTPIRGAGGKKVLYRVVHVQDVSGQTSTASKSDRAKQRDAAPAPHFYAPPPGIEQHLRRLTEHTNDVFWVMGPNFDSRQHVNSSFESVWGRPGNGLSYAQWLESIVPEDRELAAATFMRLQESGKQVTVNYRIRRPNGVLRHIKDRGIAVRDSSGPPSRIIGIATDITDRVEAESSLREAYEFNRQVMAHAQEGVFVLDLEGCCLVWNNFMEQLTGDTPSDTCGRRVEEVIPALRDPACQALLARARDGHTVDLPDLPFDQPGVRARRWCAIRIGPRRDAQGHLSGLIGAVRDVTERNQAEAKLRASEARYRSLVERASDLIYETDVAGRFTYFNSRAVTRVLGYSEQELKGMSYLDIVHPDYRTKVRTFYQRQFEDRVSNTYFEFPAVAKDGRTVWFGQNVTLLMENTRVLCHIAVARDITERKRVNERRRQNRIDMEDLQDWYVATHTALALAHEINQPLNAVCSYNEAALRLLNSGNPHPGKLVHALTASTQQAERAGKVMRDLLALLAKGHMHVSRAPVNINTLVRQVIADVQEELGALAIAMTHDLSANLKPVLSHRLHLEKVLVNLLRNSVEAIRASPCPEGKIHVKTEQHEACALVTVHDNGPGFTPEQTARILEPFYTSKVTGVGMGLPVSRALVETHGGKLWAEAGTGATVRFTVPFAP